MFTLLNTCFKSFFFTHSAKNKKTNNSNLFTIIAKTFYCSLVIFFNALAVVIKMQFCYLYLINMCKNFHTF